MHYKIYFENKPLFLLDAVDQELKPYLDKDNILYVHELSKSAMASALQSIRTQQTDAVIFFHQPLSELKEAFWNEFTIIQAAGGLVLNENQEVLCIYRRKRWDLPKGKLDPGESLEQCALREVEEETGLSRLKIEDPLLITYHTYLQDGENILKETYWYKMKAPGNAGLKPQAEEQIEEVRWVAQNQLGLVEENTYQAIKDVLDQLTVN